MYSWGQYYEQSSPVHRLDPRVKILAVVLLSVIILQADMIWLAAVFAFLIGSAWLGHIPWRFLVKTLRPVLIFFTLLFLVYLFFTPGQPLPGFPVGPIGITYQGLQMGMLQVSRFAILILAASLLTMTSTFSELTIGLEKLLRPINRLGFSSHDVSTMMSLALRFVPFLEEEMNSLREAQLARGADYASGSLLGKIRAINYLAIPLALNIFCRADAIVDAMSARGYQPGARTYLYELEMRSIDYLIIVLMIVFTSIAIIF